MKGKYVIPANNLDAFNCPHCDAYAHQSWVEPKIFMTGGSKLVPNLVLTFCNRCNQYAIWFKRDMIYPLSSMAPLAVDDMPDEVKCDFLEARSIVMLSPRSAAALLRLALQKLMVFLGEKGKDLNTDIANLVKKGLPVKVQQSLDAVRVIGNNAVHPGELDLKDDQETAIALFELLNLIVEVTITESKRVQEIYDKIPDSAKKQIEQRDK